MLTLPVLANIVSFIDTAPTVASFACVCKTILHAARTTPFRFPVHVRDPATALVVSRLPELVLRNGERRPYLDKVICHGLLHGPEVLQAAVHVELNCVIRFDLPVPPNVRTLKLGKDTNCTLRFTKGLVSLTVGKAYNHPLTDLPDTLEELMVGENYAWPLPRVTSLKMLITGRGFSHPLVLNDALETLDIDGTFNHPLVFTKNLKHVRLSVFYDQPTKLNEGLETFVASGLRHPLVLVKSLKTLTLWLYDGDLVLHEGLVSLSLGFAFVRAVGPLPSSLRNLEFGSYYNQPVHLNEGLETVHFGSEYNRPTVLPSTLKEVTFGYNYNQPTVLPHGMTKAEFGFCFQQPLVCPDTMEHLVIHSRFKSTLVTPPGCIVDIHG